MNWLLNRFFHRLIFNWLHIGLVIFLNRILRQNFGYFLLILNYNILFIILYICVNFLFMIDFINDRWLSNNWHISILDHNWWLSDFSFFFDQFLNRRRIKNFHSFPTFLRLEVFLNVDLWFIVDLFWKRLMCDNLGIWCWRSICQFDMLVACYINVCF